MNVSGFGQTKRVIRLYKNPNRTNNPDELAFPVRQDFVSRKRDGTDEPTTNHWCNAISRCSKRKLLDAAWLFQRDFTGRRIAADVAFDDRCQPDCTALSFVRWYSIDGWAGHPAGIIRGRTTSMLWRMQSGTGHDGIAVAGTGISTGFACFGHLPRNSASECLLWRNAVSGFTGAGFQFDFASPNTAL